MKDSDSDNYLPNSKIPGVLWYVKDFVKRAVEIDGERTKMFVTFGKGHNYVPHLVNIHDYGR
jgi:hypothetical protein